MQELDRAQTMSSELTLHQGRGFYLVSHRSFMGTMTSGAWRCTTLKAERALFDALARRYVAPGVR